MILNLAIIALLVLIFIEKRKDKSKQVLLTEFKKEKNKMKMYLANVLELKIRMRCMESYFGDILIEKNLEIKELHKELNDTIESFEDFLKDYMEDC